MKTSWRTLWQQRDIVIYRDEIEVDRLAAERIGRVFFFQAGAGDSPGDIGLSIVELAGPADEFALFEARTGFAGRVNFERQSFWQERACVHWVPAARAGLPWRLRLGHWRGETSVASYRRLERSALEACLARWTREAPQTWEERKQSRVERSRPFGSTTVWRAAA
jgi:hypothetical protein